MVQPRPRRAACPVLVAEGAQPAFQVRSYEEGVQLRRRELVEYCLLHHQIDSTNKIF